MTDKKLHDELWAAVGKVYKRHNDQLPLNHVNHIEWVEAVEPVVAAAVSEAQAEVERLWSKVHAEQAMVERRHGKQLAAEAEVERLREGMVDLSLRLAKASETLRTMTGDDVRLAGKREGVELARDYLRALLTPSPAATTGEADCRCGHPKADHPAPDGDTYCLHCSCAHYLPTVADMMRDAEAVGRLLADIDTQPEPPAPVVTPSAEDGA